tara:strand:- start:1021 stop:1170 length:150 start_codon:yes stop_codon:yes gene_type:complete
VVGAAVEDVDVAVVVDVVVVVAPVEVVVAVGAAVWSDVVDALSTSEVSG